jgi:nicotinate phosphoribosyltransferase
MYGIPITGTVAQSFVCSFTNIDQLKSRTLKSIVDGKDIDLWESAQKVLSDFKWETNKDELVAFVSQARINPTNFLALVDTYDSVKSGVPNFLAVSYGLYLAGYKGKGIRLDSGDLGSLSKTARQMFIDFGERYQIPEAKKFIISASNDINEGMLEKLEADAHQIDSFGIGTNLVTCQRQPALGAVYKLVEIKGVPRVKVSETLSKSSLPSRKDVYRLYDDNGVEIADLITEIGEDPVAGEISAFEMYPDVKPAVLKAARLESMLVVAWDHGVPHVDDIETVRDAVTRARTGFNRDVMSVKDAKCYRVLISNQLHGTLERLIRDSMQMK